MPMALMIVMGGCGPGAHATLDLHGSELAASWSPAFISTRRISAGLLQDYASTQANEYDPLAIPTSFGPCSSSEWFLPRAKKASIASPSVAGSTRLSASGFRLSVTW